MSAGRIAALDLLKWVGLVTMVIDHAVYLAPGSLFALHVPGRVAFPMFCLVMAAHVFRQLPGEIHRPENFTWVKKLVLYGCIAQPVFMMYTGQMVGDIMFSLAIGLGLALCYHHRSTFRPALVCAAALIIFSMHWRGMISYGLCGVLLPVAFLYAMEKKTVETWLAPALLAFAANMPVADINALILDPVGELQGAKALMIFGAAIAAASSVVGLVVCRKTLRFNVFPVAGWGYIFYPGHLVMLALTALIWNL